MRRDTAEVVANLTHARTHARVRTHTQVRRDAAEVVANLQQSSHHVAMATGDSALTAVFVGTEVSITPGDKTKELPT